MKDNIKLGKIVCARRIYKDASLGDLIFYVPIKELNTNNFLCLSFKVRGSVREISVDAISYDKATSHIIDSVADLKIFGYMDLNKDFIDYIVDTAESYLETGIRDEIVRALVACGALSKKIEKNIKLNITDLINKGACSAGLKEWSDQFGTRNITLDYAINKATGANKEWLISHFEEKITKEIYDKEQVRNYLNILVAGGNVKCRGK